MPGKSTFLAAFALLTASISTYGATAVVQMKNNFFSPATTNINVGDTVTWVQSGSNHDTVSYDGLWDSGSLRLGQTFSHTFNTAGTFNYYCTPHEAVGMKGTIIVQGSVNQPPTVTLTSPANGATFLTTDTISVSATASDNGSVAKVDFFADGNPIGTDTTSPYSTSTTLSAGTHSITAKATDNLGASTTSTPVTITVNAPQVNQPPTISLSSPQSAGAIAAPATVELQATASDPEGSIKQVEFFNGSTSVAVLTAAPYQTTVSGLAGAIYQFTAVVTDTPGLTATSSAIEIKVADAARITSIQKQSGNITINGTGTTGIQYTLYGSADLKNWTVAQTATATNGTLTFTDNSPDLSKFYKIVAE